MTDSIFTLGFSYFNLIMSVLFIASSIWFISKNYEKISEILEEKLLRSLNRLFENSGGQPIYKVFYKFNHASIESWVNWIQTQQAKRQEKAFRYLSNYIEEPANELGSLTKEVVKAITLLKHKESYQSLELLLINSGREWGKYKVLNHFYQDAANSIMLLDEDKATNFLLQELPKASSGLESSSLKEKILTALSQITDQDKLIKVFNKIILDESHNIETRIKALNLITNKEDKNIFSELIGKVLQSIFNDEKHDNKQLFQNCIEKILELIPEHENLDLWNLVIDSLKNHSFATSTAKAISERLRYDNYKINNEQIFELLEAAATEKASAYLKQALEQRFMLTENEKEILSNAASIQNIKTDDEIDHQDIFTVITTKSNKTIAVPEALQKNYDKVKELFNKKTSRGEMKLICNEVEEESYLILKAIAGKESYNLIHINTTKALLSPDKMQELEALVNSYKPCIIFLNDIFPMLELMSNETNRKADRFLKVISKFYTNKAVSVVASLAKDSIELRDSHPEVYKLIKEMPNENFYEKISLSKMTAKHKHKIIAHYEQKLEEERAKDNLEEDIDVILDSTEGYSSLEFSKFFLEYLGKSLLSHGKLIPISEYKNLLSLYKARGSSEIMSV